MPLYAGCWPSPTQGSTKPETGIHTSVPGDRDLTTKITVEMFHPIPNGSTCQHLQTCMQCESCLAHVAVAAKRTHFA